MNPPGPIRSAAPTRLAPPLWADPRYLLAASAVRRTRPTAEPAGDTVVAPADPTRIAIGFVFDRAFGAGTAFVCPGGPAEFEGMPVLSTVGMLWFDLFTFGPLINLQWNGFLAGNSCLIVYEWYLQ